MIESSKIIARKYFSCFLNQKIPALLLALRSIFTILRAYYFLLIFLCSSLIKAFLKLKIFLTQNNSLLSKYGNIFMKESKNIILNSTHLIVSMKQDIILLMRYFKESLSGLRIFFVKREFLRPQAQRCSKISPLPMMRA